MSSCLRRPRSVLMRVMRGGCSFGSINLEAQVRSTQQHFTFSRKKFHSSSRRFVNISFNEESTGEIIEVDAEEGKTILDIAMDHKIDIEGACGGELACSTCHVVLPQEVYDSLDPISEEEEDMLDLAWGVTDTSRLGCQVKIGKNMEGVEIVVPTESNSML